MIMTRIDRFVGVLQVAVAANLAAPSAQAHGQPTSPRSVSHSIVDLRCGTAAFIMTTTHYRQKGEPLAPVKQALKVIVAGKAVPLALERAGTVVVDGRRVQRAYVGSWACVTASTGLSYVMLGYACAIDPGYRDECEFGKEWTRLLDDRGRALDARVRPDTPDANRIADRLGLAATLEAGVPMQDAFPIG